MIHIRWTSRERDRRVAEGWRECDANIDIRREREGGVGGENVWKSDIKCEQRRENRIKRRRYTREKERES